MKVIEWTNKGISKVHIPAWPSKSPKQRLAGKRSKNGASERDEGQ
jgi:hypothetical protein